MLLNQARLPVEQADRIANRLWELEEQLERLPFWQLCPIQNDAWLLIQNEVTEITSTLLS